MHCPFYSGREESCSACSVEVRFIDCARLGLCAGKKYEACPVYFVNLLFGLSLVSAARA